MLKKLAQLWVSQQKKKKKKKKQLELTQFTSLLLLLSATGGMKRSSSLSFNYSETSQSFTPLSTPCVTSLNGVQSKLNPNLLWQTLSYLPLVELNGC